MNPTVTCEGGGLTWLDLIAAVHAWSDGWDQSIPLQYEVLLMGPLGISVINPKYISKLIWVLGILILKSLAFPEFGAQSRKLEI
jgi:hypothetical protein